MFSNLKAQVTARFTQMAGKEGSALLNTAYDRDAIWKAYFDAFPEEFKQSNNCNCCQAFIRQIGGIVVIGNDNTRHTLWDFEVSDPEYSASVAALRDFVHAQPIDSIFYHNELMNGKPLSTVGTDRSVVPARPFTPAQGEFPDLPAKPAAVWQHFFVQLPKPLVGDKAAIAGKFRETKVMMERALKELSPDSVSLLVDLIKQGSVYRGEEFLKSVQAFQQLQSGALEVPADQLENYLWRLAAGGKHDGVARIKNSAIGTLLTDLSEGVKEIDAAVESFGKKLDPTNYKRPKAVVTPMMVENAKKRLGELGLLSALERRRLDTRDLTAENALYTFRPTKKAGGGDVFDQLKGDATKVDIKKLAKVDEITMEKFLADVLPTAKSLQVLLENRHLNHLVTLTGAVDPEAKPLFNWDNSIGWSYTGGVGDSLRDQVAAKGGRVDGVFRFSHSWNHDGQNQSLMDLHVFMPPYAHKQTKAKEVHDHYPSSRRVGWNHRKDTASGGIQDVDFTTAPGKAIPVENITFPTLKSMPEGTYTMKIHNWQARHPNTSGFKAEIEFGGEVFEYQRREHLGDKEWITVAEVTLKGGQFTIKHLMESTSSDTVKWGLKTNSWHGVRAVTLSPNHWTKPVGNKHWFFMLEGAVSDEVTRPFLNEFLVPELAGDRKVTEALGAKIEVLPADGAELSGLGFSSTVRNHLFVKVGGTFDRILKVTI